MLLAARPAAAQTDTASWAAFKSQFITAEGRVVDTGNAGISHSEGQGWGMLLAVSENDEPTFNALWQWTARTLRRSQDPLHSWRYRPNAGVGVDDPNNATDGDIYIAWALANAARRWNRSQLRDSAARIAQALLGLCTLRIGEMLVLLPGVNGFATATEVTLNPSYFVFPAFRVFAEIAPDPRWGRLERDSLQLIDRGRFGVWQLPPDWLSLQRATGDMQPAQNWPPRFGFDAVRVPLLVGWGRYADAAILAAARRFWSSGGAGGGPPAWVDLRSAEVAPYRASEGVLAVARLTEALVQGHRFPQLGAPVVTADYYASTLSLLAQIAARDIAQGVP